MAQTTTQKQNGQIEFLLQLSPEQYEIFEFLAKLNGAETLESYIHNCINAYLQGSTDYIKDEKTKKLAEATFQSWGTCLGMDQTIILHGTYEPSMPAEMKVITAIAEGQGYKDLSEFIQSAIKGGAYSDMDHLKVFDGTKQMEETLKEA